MIQIIVRPIVLVVSVLSCSTLVAVDPFPTEVPFRSRLKRDGVVTLLSVNMQTTKAQRVPTTVDDRRSLAKTTFRVVKVLSGEESQKHLELTCFEAHPAGTTFFVEGNAIGWRGPVPLTQQGVTYLEQLRRLPEKGVEQWEYFIKYLEHADAKVARDVYLEFKWNCEHEDYKAIKSKLDRQQLRGWIENDEIPKWRKSLYVLMLAYCGTSEDVEFLESLLTASQPKVALHELVPTYLLLAGAKGLPQVEQLLFDNPKLERIEAHEGFSALCRFSIGPDRFPRKRMISAVRRGLDHQVLARIAISNLAKLEDWESLEKVVALFYADYEMIVGLPLTKARKSSFFKQFTLQLIAKKDTNIVFARKPRSYDFVDFELGLHLSILSYLKDCPRPDARKHYEKLSALDPRAKRLCESKDAPYPGRTDYHLILVAELSEDKIIAAELQIDRAFLNHPLDGNQARYLVSCMLRAAIPSNEISKVKSLVREIAEGAKTDQPSDAYATFLGEKPMHKKELGQLQLILKNQEEDGLKWLVIRVALSTARDKKASKTGSSK